MKHAHEQIKPDQILKEKQTLEAPPQENGGYSAFYKNYLKDIKDNNAHKHQKINSQVLKSVLDNPDQS